MLTRATIAVVMVAAVQAPVRFATYALRLRRLRRACPEMFDGRACAEAIAACIDEYQREIAAERPWGQGAVGSGKLTVTLRHRDTQPEETVGAGGAKRSRACDRDR